MNIVVISGMFKVPASSGGEKVMQDYLVELSKYHNLTLIYPGKENYNTLFNSYNINCITFDQLRVKYNSYINLYDKVKLWLFSKKIKDFTERYFAGYYPYINNYLKDNLSITNGSTIIQVDFPWLMGIVNHIRNDIPLVFVVHEIQFIKYQREALTQQNMGNKEKMENCLALSKKYEKYEVNTLNKYSAIFTLSKSDKEILLSKKIEAPVFESTLGIDISQIDKLNHENFNKLVFIGNGAHYPNLDALIYYVENILPLLNNILPNIKLFVTGNYEQSFISKFSSTENIVWCGFVDDLDEILLNAVCIVPIRIGSGIRIKILEAMARGCPVVSTEIGIEGIDVTNGKHAIFANEPEDFVNGIYSIVSQPAFAINMSISAREFVEENYNVKKSAYNRIELFKNKLV